jgi:hypothetical protein
MVSPEDEAKAIDQKQSGRDHSLQSNVPARLRLGAKLPLRNLWKSCPHNRYQSEGIANIGAPGKGIALAGSGRLYCNRDQFVRIASLCLLYLAHARIAQLQIVRYVLILQPPYLLEMCVGKPTDYV